ncbi:unnamed protein product, partial [Iphiclides podalirius]
MSQILTKVRDVDPNNGDSVKEVLTSYFQNVVKHTEVNCNQWLQTLEDILNRFPRYCSSHRTTIETYLSHFVSGSNYYDVIYAAKCAHALQQVRWPQDRTATAKSAWRDQMELLCNAAHSLIDALFVESVDLYKGKGKKVHTQSNSNSPLTTALLRITATGGSIVKNKGILQNRIRNIFIFIQAMIVEMYPVAKPIRPQIILDVIVRALSVTSGKNHVSNDVAPVKIQALRTIDALIACLDANLIPFSPLVFRIVMQTLRWTTDNPSQDSRDIRKSAYSTLVNWLTTLHSHRFTTGNSSWEDELTSHIIGDTTPTKKTVQLTMSGQSLKNLSKKARRKLQNTMLKESTISAHMPGEKNKHIVEEENDTEVAMSALECAEVFLSVCGVFLKPTTHKVFQEHFVRECYSARIYSSDYLLSLLHVLEALRKTTPPTVPPPTQYCLHLYSTLTNNHSKEISKFCCQALLDIRLHLHCSPPSISFALETRPEKEKAIEKRKIISERNIAALEKLLGPDKVPRQSGNEIITVSDEPLYKKSRLDDEVDNISLSSASVCSVEIHDVIEENPKTPKELTNENKVNNETSPVNEQCNKNYNNEVKNTEVHVIEENDEDVEILELNITEDAEEIEKNTAKNVPIYEQKTQIPLNSVNDGVDDEERSLSMEVAYDYPNGGSGKVTVLEKLDDENLPSTNETDDVQITCGQVLLTSQEIEPENQPKETVKMTPDHEMKINGIIESNGDINEAKTQVAINTESKLCKIDGITVEDMLADFVDEVDDKKVAV